MKAVTITFAGKDELSPTLGKLQNETNKTQTRMAAFGKASKVAATALLAGFAFAVKAGVSEMMDAQKVGAQTDAVLKSTGNAANVSADQVSNLSEALMRKSGVDDEVIQSGANVLLTFTNIRNEVGKGNDIFNQATATALDMSTALGTDLKSANIQLGKALNDPVKGITALQRVGVSFTQQQKDQIKALVENGKTMDAQKLILKELNKEFGGSAEAAGKTLPGQLAIARESFNNLLGSLVQGLLPAFQSFVSIVSVIVGWMTRHQTATKVLVIALASLAGTVLVVEKAIKVWRTAQLLLNAALAANPIGLVVIAVAALAAGLIYAYKHSETFRNIVNGAFNAVKGAAQAVLGFFQGNWRTIATLISGPFAPIVALATNMFGVRSALVNGAKKAMEGVKTAFNTLIRFVADLGQTLYSIATGVGAAIVEGIWSGISSATGWLKDKITGFADSVMDHVKSVFKIGSPSKRMAKEVGGPLVDGIEMGINEKRDKVKKALVNKLRAALTAARQTATSLASGISSSIGQALDKKLAGNLAALGNSPEAQRLRAIQAQQAATNKQRERARLDSAIASAETPEERMQAQQDLDDWLLEQEAQTLEASLQQQQDNLQADTEAKKAAAEQQITDLVDSLNRGQIKTKEFQTQLQSIIGGTGVEWATIGSTLGTAFANGFNASVDKLLALGAKIPGTQKKLSANTGKGKGSNSININVYDRTTTGMSREQARQIANDISPFLNRQVAI